MIQAIILAAGRSTRMGEQKLLRPFRGVTMVDFVITTVRSCGFDGTSVVVSRETMDCLSPVTGADYIVNPNPDRGQDSSFHCALAALPACSSFAVFLADKPTVTAWQIMELRRLFESIPTEKNALVPRQNGAPGHPAFYAPIWRDRFLGSEGISRDTLFRYKNDVEWVDAYESCFLDVDTPEDYRRILEKNIGIE